jgi:hypothetical protein
MPKRPANGVSNRKFGHRAGRCDAANLIGIVFGEPEVAVRPGDDATWLAANGRDGVFGHGVDDVAAATRVATGRRCSARCGRGCTTQATSRSTTATGGAWFSGCNVEEI